MTIRGAATFRSGRPRPRLGLLLPLSAALLGGCSQAPTRQEIKVAWEQQRAALKYELASNELKEGRTEKALQLAQEAVGLSPNDAGNVELLARTYLAKGDFPAARGLLEAARELHPGAAALAYLLGAVYERERNWPQAIAAYASAARNQPDNLDFCIAWSQAQAQWGDAEGAVRTLSESETRFRDQPAFHLARAEILRRAGQLEPACAAYRAALGLGYESAAVRESLGLCLYWLGRYEEVIAYLDPLTRGAAAPSAAVCSAYAGSLLALRQAARAEAWLTEQSHTRLDEPAIWLLLAQARLQLGNPRTAVDAARYATRLRPESADGWCLLALAQHSAGRPDEARAAVRRALDLQPAHEEALLLAERLRREAERE